MNPRYWRMFRWLYPRNDPRRYGAIPNGKKDCTAAIQRCLDQGGMVMGGGGTYRVTATLHIRDSK